MSVLRISTSRAERADGSERNTTTRGASARQPSEFERAFREQLPERKQDAPVERKPEASRAQPTRKVAKSDRKPSSSTAVDANPMWSQQHIVGALPSTTAQMGDATDTARGDASARALANVDRFALPGTDRLATTSARPTVDRTTAGSATTTDPAITTQLGAPVAEGAIALTSGLEDATAAMEPVSGDEPAPAAESARPAGEVALDQATDAHTPSEPAQRISPELVADLISQQSAPKPQVGESERFERVARADDHAHAFSSAASRVGAPLQLLASDAPAPVEATKQVREVDWHGLAERLANVGAGSIEGHRARLVIGSGDERVVMTISTHEQRVSVEVEQNTPAGQAMAEALRHGQDELRQALGRHGLDLAQQDARQSAAQDLDERRAPQGPRAAKQQPPRAVETTQPRGTDRVVLA